MGEAYFVRDRDGVVHIAGVTQGGDSSTLCSMYLAESAQGGFDDELCTDYKVLDRATPHVPDALRNSSRCSISQMSEHSEGG